MATRNFGLSPDSLRGGSDGPRMSPFRPHRELRTSRGANGVYDGVYAKLPKTIGIEETNVVFGLGTATGAGAGTAALSQTVPRPIMLRDLVIATGGVRGRVTSFTAAGLTLLLGSTAAVEAFSPLNPIRPSIDLPVYTGNISVNVTLDAAYTIDAAILID